MTGPPGDGSPEDPAPEEAAPHPPEHPSARELVRGRKRPGRLPDTGRRHHIGSAPEAVPLHTPTGVELTRVTSWQLADRTPAQLAAQHAATATQMRRAAEDLDFEIAARLRDELAALEDEISRRGAPAAPADRQDPAGQQPEERQPPAPPGDGPPTSAGSAG